MEPPRSLRPATTRSGAGTRRARGQVPGNHEYESSGAQPYFDYFGGQAGPSGTGLLQLSALATGSCSRSTATCRSAARQRRRQWIRSELTANTSRCALAYFHHPLYSSGPNGDNARLAGLWQMLYEQGVDVIISAHEHLYERYAPMSPDGQRNDARGIRQFIVGHRRRGTLHRDAGASAERGADHRARASEAHADARRDTAGSFCRLAADGPTRARTSVTSRPVL